jgi:hypothetical protein
MSSSGFEKLSVKVGKLKLARMKLMAEDREMPVEEFASELIELGLLSMKSNWPRLGGTSTIEASYSVTVDLDGE